MIIRSLALVAALVAGPALAQAAEPLSIHAVNAPLAYFAERLTGGSAEVEMPVPAGADPATWRPGIAEISGMQQADLILLNGAELYGWTQRVSLPRARVVDTIRGFPEGSLIQVEGSTHSHGDEPEHSHAAIAPNTWLDFRLARLQAAAVAEAIVRLRPEEGADVEDRLAELDAELAAFEAEAAQVGVSLAGEPVIAYHRGYEYLARTLGLDIVALSWDVDAAPDAAALAELDAALAQHPARLMIFSTEPGPEAVAALAERGIDAVLFDTAAAVASDAVKSTLASGLAALKAATRGP